VLKDSNSANVRTGWFNLKKWKGDYWDQIDASGNINQSGKFSLRLEPPISGEESYQIDFDSYDSSGKRLPGVIREFSLKSDGTHSIGTGAEWLPASSLWTVVPPPPNLSGVVKSPALVGVATSMSVYKKVGGDSNDSEAGYWQLVDWSDSSSSNSELGSYAILLELEGDYRVDVQPPYNSTESFSGFSKYFRVGTGLLVSTCTEAFECAVASGPIDLNFPTPNLKGTVSVSEGGPSVANGWIYAYKWRVTEGNNGYWEWINQYGSINSRGKYAFNLDDGDYRLVVQTYNRLWESQPQFYKYVRIGAGGQSQEIDSGRALIGSTLIDATFNMTVPESNVTITVNDGNGAETLVPSKGSWIAIWGTNGMDFWSSYYTDLSGRVRIYLPDGSYEADAYPRWGSSTSPTARFKIVVSEGIVSSWSYIVSGQESAQCQSTPCEVMVQLDRVPPNVTGTVAITDGSSVRSGSGAFVIARRADGSIAARSIADWNGRYQLLLEPDEAYVITVTVVVSGVPHSASSSETPTEGLQETYDFNVMVP
jgi:hypothetical protein